MGALFSFLQRNSVMMAKSLPFVHSTEALHLKNILRSKQVDATYCKVFNEGLAYFFVGRPAYKTEIGAEAEYWELPCCFILKEISDPPKRIYPFDSGGFASRPSQYPNFITMMDLDEFEIARDVAGVQKLIGTFFTSCSRYFMMQPRQESDFMRRFSIDVTDEEIQALFKLIKFKSGAGDDRRLSMELQFESPVTLDKDNVLAVVIPDIYSKSNFIMKSIELDLAAEVLSYPVYPIKKEYHYHAIYDVVHRFYQDKGLI